MYDKRELNNIDWYDAFRWYLGCSVLSNFRNPFRDDKKGNCYIEEWNGLIVMVDWGDKRYLSKTLLQVIEVSKNLSREEAIRFLLFNYKKRINLKRKKTSNKKKTFKKKIFPVFRSFTEKDANYWKDYGITSSNLQNENVKAVKYYTTNYKNHPERLVIRNVDMGYCITINGKHKIYQPLIKNFDTNQTALDVGGLKPFKGNDILIISKSYKDYQVIVNEGFNCRYLLCETVNPPESLLQECKHFNKVIIFMDNDIPGMEAGKRICELAPNMVNYILPIFENVTDPADYYKKFGNSQLWVNQINKL